jgi:hypothetical protein
MKVVKIIEENTTTKPLNQNNMKTAVSVVLHLITQINKYIYVYIKKN